MTSPVKLTAAQRRGLREDAAAETPGRALYRAIADAEARAQLSIAKRAVKLSGRAARETQDDR